MPHLNLPDDNHIDPPDSEEREPEPATGPGAKADFVAGAQQMREVLARFVEHDGHATLAQSIRLNWDPAWGADPGARTLAITTRR